MEQFILKDQNVYPGIVDNCNYPGFVLFPVNPFDRKQHNGGEKKKDQEHRGGVYRDDSEI